MHIFSRNTFVGCRLMCLQIVKTMVSHLVVILFADILVIWLSTTEPESHVLTFTRLCGWHMEIWSAYLVHQTIYYPRHMVPKWPEHNASDSYSHLKGIKVGAFSWGSQVNTKMGTPSSSSLYCSFKKSYQLLQTGLQSQLSSAGNHPQATAASQTL